MADTPQNVDPAITAQVNKFRLWSSTPGTSYYRKATEFAAANGLSHQDTVNDLANELQQNLAAPRQNQNPQEASLLSMIPIIGPMLSMVPAIGEFFSGLFRAFGDMMNGKGFDLAKAQQEMQQEHIDNRTMAFLQGRGFAPASLLPTARNRILVELNTTPTAQPTSIPGAPPGVVPPLPTPVNPPPGPPAQSLVGP